MERLNKRLIIWAVVGLLVGGFESWCHVDAQVKDPGTAPDGYSAIRIAKPVDENSDISAEIQNAIDRLGTNGGLIYLPEGNLRIGEQVIRIAPRTDNLVIMGAGMRRTVLHLKTMSQGINVNGKRCAFQLGDSAATNDNQGQVRFLTIKGFSVIYDGGAGSAGGDAIGFLCSTTRRSLFEDVWVEGINIGFLCKNVSDFNIFRGVYVRNCTRCAVWLENQSNGNRFEGCDFLQTVAHDLAQAPMRGSGLRIDYWCLQNVIQNCRFHNFNGSNSEEAVFIGDASRTCAIRDNYFENCDIGVRLIGGNAGPVSGILIEGNYFFAMRKSAIVLGSSNWKYGIQGITVSSNTIENTAKAGGSIDGAGITLEDNSYDVSLINNTYLGFDRQGKRKVLHGTKLSGIQISGSKVDSLSNEN